MSTSGKDASSFVRASSTVIRSTASGAWRASKPPLPGLAEVGGAMKALIGSMKAGGSESEECTLLMERIENLLGVAQDFDDSRHPELADMVRQLCELKDKFETESKRQSGILGAERRQSMLDRLACKVGGIVEATSLRIQLRQAEEGSNPIDNFPMVGAHEITEQTILYKGTRGLEHALEHVARFGRLGESVCDSPVTSVTRCGWLGKVPVVYKTYSSRSDDAAAKVAEAELKFLSRCSHPNFATVIGITKGYSGLNGYVVTAGEIPVHQFISTVDRGAPLVKFVRGILEVKGLDLKDALGVSSTRGHITVQPNGHLTIFPVLDNENDSRSVDLRRPIASEAFNAVMNPATRLAVDVYLRPFRTGTMSPVHKFLDSVAALGWETFTPLEVARLAAECEVTPAESWQPLGGSSGAMPLLFLNDGNIEHSRACDFLGVRWEPIEAGQAAPSMVVEHIKWDSGHPTVRKLVDVVEGTQWRTSVQFSDELGLDMSYVVAIRPTVGVVPEPLYFHRNLSCSEPRGFWGFLSTSADPRSNIARLEGMDQMIKHHIMATTVCLTDMWDYKYKRMVRSSLASIPGSYPGSQVGDPVDDEDD